jgi:hypothetical protein
MRWNERPIAYAGQITHCCQSFDSVGYRPLRQSWIRFFQVSFLKNRASSTLLFNAHSLPVVFFQYNFMQLVIPSDAFQPRFRPLCRATQYQTYMATNQRSPVLYITPTRFRPSNVIGLHDRPIGRGLSTDACTYIDVRSRTYVDISMLRSCQ